MPTKTYDKNIKVQQEVIDRIKNMGMGAAVKAANTGDQSAEFVEGAKRMYGTRRVGITNAAKRASSVSSPTVIATSPTVTKSIGTAKKAVAPAKKSVVNAGFGGKKPPIEKAAASVGKIAQGTLAKTTGQKPSSEMTVAEKRKAFYGKPTGIEQALSVFKSGKATKAQKAVAKSSTTDPQAQRVQQLLKEKRAAAAQRKQRAKK